MSEPEIKVRTVPMLLSPFVEIGRQFFDIARNPTAFFGSLVGSALLSGGVAALVLFGPTFEIPEAGAEDDELEMEFMPGELVRLGPKLDPQDIPEKIIVEETRAAETAAETKVTTDEKAKPTTEPKKKEEKSDVKATEKPDPNKGKDVKVSDKNRDSNTPYKDLPTVKDLPGDPFGSADGWSDTFKEGDPWATEVMKVLNGMQVGTFGAEGKDAEYKFRLEVCPDGKLAPQRKGSTGDATLDTRIESAIKGLKVSVPKSVADLLKGQCKMIQYEFVWRGKGQGRGSVK